MKSNFLFRKNIDPFCVYCKKSNILNKTHCACKKHGVVALNFGCRHFEYDALKRVPPKPAVLKLGFSSTDFTID